MHAGFRVAAPTSSPRRIFTRGDTHFTADLVRAARWAEHARRAPGRARHGLTGPGDRGRVGHGRRRRPGARRRINPALGRKHYHEPHGGRDARAHACTPPALSALAEGAARRRARALAHVRPGSSTLQLRGRRQDSPRTGDAIRHRDRRLTDYPKHTPPITYPWPQTDTRLGQRGQNLLRLKYPSNPWQKGYGPWAGNSSSGLCSAAAPRCGGAEEGELQHKSPNGPSRVGPGPAHGIA